MGFIRDVRRIVGYLPRQRQSMLFSATMPAAVAHLVAEILKNPVRVDISPPKIDRRPHRSAGLFRGDAR